MPSTCANLIPCPKATRTSQPLKKNQFSAIVERKNQGEDWTEATNRYSTCQVTNLCRKRPECGSTAQFHEAVFLFLAEWCQTSLPLSQTIPQTPPLYPSTLCLILLHILPKRHERESHIYLISYQQPQLPVIMRKCIIIHITKLEPKLTAYIQTTFGKIKPGL